MNVTRTLGSGCDLDSETHTFPRYNSILEGRFFDPRSLWSLIVRWFRESSAASANL